MQPNLQTPTVFDFLYPAKSNAIDSIFNSYTNLYIYGSQKSSPPNRPTATRCHDNAGIVIVSPRADVCVPFCRALRQRHTLHT